MKDNNKTTMEVYDRDIFHSLQREGQNVDVEVYDWDIFQQEIFFFFFFNSPPLTILKC